jgi:hypothetical protein
LLRNNRKNLNTNCFQNEKVWQWRDICAAGEKHGAAKGAKARWRCNLQKTNKNIY